MTEVTLDRNSTEVAEQVMSALCSSMEEQQVVLRQLLGSIHAAARHSPNSWAVTLFGNGFRLNVGPVEAFTFFDGYVRLLFLGIVPAETQEHGEVFPMQYRSVPQPQNCYIGSIPEFHVVAKLLHPLHERFLEAAAVTAKGHPRKSSPFKHSQSLGLVAYAEGVITQSQAVTLGPSTLASAYFVEGTMRRVASNRYERNAEARRRCIEVFGPTCVICGVNFQLAYGASATGFIHVHHVTPLSAIGQSYTVNPVTDLVPLCPNCHSVVHLSSPPYSIEQVKAMRAASPAEQAMPTDHSTAAAQQQDDG